MPDARDCKVLGSLQTLRPIRHLIFEKMETKKYKKYPNVTLESVKKQAEHINESCGEKLIDTKGDRDTMIRQIQEFRKQLSREFRREQKIKKSLEYLQQTDQIN